MIRQRIRIRGQRLARLPPPNVEIDRETDWPENLSFIRDYWLDRRGSRFMPGRNDISAAQLKAHLPYLLLADVIDGGADFRYRLVGTELRQFFRAEPSAKRMSEALAPFGAETVEATLISYRAVVERRADASHGCQRQYDLGHVLRVGREKSVSRSKVFASGGLISTA
jgi:hypothetical protein